MISAYIGLIERALGPACRVLHGYESGAAPNRRSEARRSVGARRFYLGRCKSTPPRASARAMAPVPVSDGA